MKCDRCNGTGAVRVLNCADGDVSVDACFRCDGRGVIEDQQEKSEEAL